MADDPFDKTFSEKAESFMKQYFGDEFWSGFEKRKPAEKDDCPKLDLLESDSEVMLLVELPGLRSPDDVEVTVTNIGLKLKGSLFTPKPSEARCHFTEFKDGSFQKEVSLPAPIDTTSQQAGYRRGILEIRMRKKVTPATFEFNFFE